MKRKKITSFDNEKIKFLRKLNKKKYRLESNSFLIENAKIIIKNNGNVGIGINPVSGFKLTVDGKIISEDVTVVEYVGADFVFADAYVLPKLEDVEKFIEKNKHLPEIPSAEEMKTNGLEIGDMQIKLLQKVEELTLYMIEQQKMIKKQQEEIEELKMKSAPQINTDLHR